MAFQNIMRREVAWLKAKAVLAEHESKLDEQSGYHGHEIIRLADGSFEVIVKVDATYKPHWRLFEGMPIRYDVVY